LFTRLASAIWPRVRPAARPITSGSPAFTKSFTATAILQLVDPGSLSLDSRLVQFAPGIPHSDQIAVRQLLNMTAGVYDYFDEAR